MTLGFARRFAGYKRPNLLLHDPDRLGRLLASLERPVQIIVAGKAHPRDAEGKRLLQGWAEFVRRPAVRSRAVLLEDYDMSLAQELVQGVDVWINTPRRPWEACGTSGMKVLVNGGLNLSELDGWWAEAYRADAGWALDGDDGADIGLGCRRGRAAVRSAGAGDHPGVLRAGRAGHSARVGRADPRQHGQPRAELQQQPDDARVRRAALPARRVGVPRP